MKNAVTQRVMEVLESKNITPNALADKLGMYQQTISKQLKDNGSGVSLTTIVGILELFPDLSAEWLLRGEGEMEKGERKVTKEYVPVQDTELVDALRDHIATLKEANAALKAENEQLKREKMPSVREYGFVAAEGSGNILLTKPKKKTDVTK